jgi:hypothetical protein
MRVLNRETVTEFSGFKIGETVYHNTFSGGSFRIDTLTKRTWSDGTIDCIASENFTAYSCFELNTSNLSKERV